jgi:hypothetical protein
MYLERSPGRAENLDDLWPCVRAADEEMKLGKTALSPEEEQALGGRDVSGFLDWSLSGPRPVVRGGRPAEQESSVHVISGPPLATQLYVLCLLQHGYQWPAAAK